MPRKKRIWYKDAAFHVMGRGNRRKAIFKEAEDYHLFLALIKAVKKRYPFEVHAYCLMSNHFHMEISTGETPLWKIMQPVMNHYARTFNQKYGFSGHLFESRYTSCLIEDDRYFLEVSRYIHLNPVKAMMVREPASYEYSSYSNYISDNTDRSDDLLSTRKILGAFHGDQRDQYRMFVEGKISHAEQELLIQKEIGEDEYWLPW